MNFGKSFGFKWNIGLGKFFRRLHLLDQEQNSAPSVKVLESFGHPQTLLQGNDEDWLSKNIHFEGEIGHSLVRSLPKNTNGRDFIIGDLHGCYDELHALLTRVDFDTEKDRVLSVGDLIDRGPYVSDCLRLLDEPWFFAVRGNHEQLWLKWYWEQENPEKILQSSVASSEQKSLVLYAKKLLQLPYVMVIGDGDFVIVHAEIAGRYLTLDDIIKGRISARQQSEILWSRKFVCHPQKVLGQHHLSLPTIYCGHSIVPGLLRIGQQVYLDHGCFLAYRSMVKSNHQPPILPRLSAYCPQTGLWWYAVAKSRPFVVRAIPVPVSFWTNGLTALLDPDEY